MTASRFDAAKVEHVLSDAAILAAPPLTLFVTGSILADHLWRYAYVFPPTAIAAGIGIVCFGMALMIRQAALKRHSLTAQAAKMDVGFIWYIGTIAVVNGLLSVGYIWQHWQTPDFEQVQRIFAAIAEMAIGLIDVPMAWLMSASADLQAVMDANGDADAKLAADKAQAFADEQTALDNENRRKIEAQDAETANALRLKEFEAGEAAKKRAERVVKSPQPTTTPPATQQQPAQPLPKRIDLAKLKAALIDNPKETLPKLAQPFGVTSQAVGSYIRDHGGRDAIINGQ